MRVAVYSGSFNPLHIGHLAVLRSLCGAGFFDCVRLVVSPKNPLKDIDESSARARFDAALAAVGRHPELAGKVIVDDIEFGLPLPNYTINTLDALSCMYPDDSFTLVVGGDQFADIRRWRDFDRILREYGLAVYPREGYDIAAVRDSLLAEDQSFRICLLDAQEVDMSSTEIRAALAGGRDVSAWTM